MTNQWRMDGDGGFHHWSSLESPSPWSCPLTSFFGYKCWVPQPLSSLLITKILLSFVPCQILVATNFLATARTILAKVKITYIWISTWFLDLLLTMANFCNASSVFGPSFVVANFKLTRIDLQLFFILLWISPIHMNITRKTSKLYFYFLNSFCISLFTKATIYSQQSYQN